jgi:fumarylacetoacetase
MRSLDETHDPRTGSWVASAQRAGSDFPIQNLPLGVFRRGQSEAHIGMAIGDRILDLHRAVQVGALPVEPSLYEPLRASLLNPLLSRGRRALRDLRAAAFALLREDSRLPRPPDECLVPMEGVDLLLPVQVGDYTDFYASIHHATNVGKMLRPDQPLLPNYKWVPIGYHGRASSLVPSGTPVRRPRGQLLREGEAAPALRATEALDYESEVGIVVGKGNALGESIGIDAAEEHIAGLCLVNDWSARDVQRWEYQPLGPFLAKNFATTLSPWLVTLDALEPYRTANAERGPGDPAPLAYLDEGARRSRSGFAIALEVRISSAMMRREEVASVPVSACRFTDMYWTAAQLVAHHTSNGCNLRPGDLLASGTVSGPGRTARGCLLELTWRGSEPLTLPTGEVRRFLEDGDEVEMRGICSGNGAATIGFGECRGIVLPAEGGDR